mmetsp:Transcript_9447/g.19441  ORF Transcript_9447/g.19441 Transcript_9447/m.19441 type:complete len:280 (+) Transcript_9447:920-1759(+)
MVVLFLLLVLEPEDHLLDGVDDLVEGALLLRGELRGELLHGTGVGHPGLLAQQIEGLLELRHGQLQQGCGGLHRRRRWHRVRGRLRAHARNLRQNLHGGLDGLDLVGAGLGALGPLHLLDVAGLLRVGECLLIGVEVVLRVTAIRLRLVLLRLGVAMDRLLLRPRGVLGVPQLFARLLRELESVQGVRLLRVHLRQLVVELEPQLFQQFDHALGFEAIPLHVAGVVALCLEVRALLRLVALAGEGRELGALLRTGREAEEREHLADTLPRDEEGGRVCL